MKSRIFGLMMLVVFISAGCKKDNLKAPSSTITGNIVFNKQSLGVRSNGVQLELWQHGFQLFSKIPVYIQQDGSFSAKVFDGNYKLTLLRGNGPWADKTDTIDVAVNGEAKVEVAVDPFFVIAGENFQKSGTNINSTFNIQRVNTTKALELVRIFVGQTLITDQNNNAGTAQKLAAAIPDISQPISLSIAIPSSLATKDYVYVRVGVKAVGVAELLYSAPQMVMLK